MVGTSAYFIVIFVPLEERSRCLIVTFVSAESSAGNVPLKFFNLAVSISIDTVPLPETSGFATFAFTVAFLIADDKSFPPNLSLLAGKSSSFLDSFKVTLSVGIVISLPVY